MPSNSLTVPPASPSLLSLVFLPALFPFFHHHTSCSSILHAPFGPLRQPEWRRTASRRLRAQDGLLRVETLWPC
jgi:hypothetical protein